MRRRIDQSPFLANLIKFLSNALAEQRGLVPILGVIVAIVGLIILLVNVFLDVKVIAFIGILLQGVGLIASLIGLLLAEPLGK